MKIKLTKTMRWIIAVLAIALLAYSTVNLVIQVKHYKAEQEALAHASELAEADDITVVEPEPEPKENEIDTSVEKLAHINLDILRDTNKEVLGWIYIHGTNMSFPLVQHSDNQYYLRKTWDRQYNRGGCIFLECQCKKDFSDFNTIIYGHHMRNGSMFAGLANFKSQEYYDSHQYIYIRTLNEVRRYRIFACYDAATDSPVFYVGHNDKDLKKELVSYQKKQNRLKTDVNITIDNHIISLVTCTGNGYAKRTVVQAVLESSWTLDDLEDLINLK